MDQRIRVPLTITGVVTLAAPSHVALWCAPGVGSISTDTASIVVLPIRAGS